MNHADFVHLRVHTAYSLTEGAIRVEQLAGLCVRHRMPAVAITDTNNLFGALEGSKALAGKGIQPIIGCRKPPGPRRPRRRHADPPTPAAKGRGVEAVPAATCKELPQERQIAPTPTRSEERRVGKESVSTCRSRWTREHK